MAHAQGPKEKCFQAAVEQLQKAKKFPDGTEFDHQKPWTQNTETGQWRPEPEKSTFGELIGSFLKTIGLRDANRDVTEGGRWPTGQFRFPDVTVTRPDAKKVVIDTKFDRPSGGTDTWSKKQGAGSRQTQEHDYNDINEQQNGRKKQSLSLDPKSCECSGNTEPVKVYEPQPMPDGQFYVVPTPGALPALPSLPAPAPMPIPVIP